MIRLYVCSQTKQHLIKININLMSWKKIQLKFLTVIFRNNSNQSEITFCRILSIRLHQDSPSEFLVGLKGLMHVQYINLRYASTNVDSCTDSALSSMSTMACVLGERVKVPFCPLSSLESRNPPTLAFSPEMNYY